MNENKENAVIKLKPNTTDQIILREEIIEHQKRKTEEKREEKETA